jgi:hypothetical protein
MTGRAATNLDTFIVVGAALLLFGPTATNLVARVTDISALRILDGDIPYRDFWTMYAPGSFVTVALAFTVFGRELIVSSLLGILASVAAVALYFRLLSRVAGAALAALVTGIVMLAFYGDGYHNGLTSYPPALLLILAALSVTVRRIADAGARWAALPGMLLGLAALYKHDVAGYAAIAAACAIVAARRRASAMPALAPVAVMMLSAGTVVLAAASILTGLGAGPDAWENLVTFPLGDFRHARREYFPLLPAWRPSVVGMAQEISRWGQGMVPVFVFVAGVIGLRRAWRELPAPQLLVLVFAAVAFWLHWIAAHVQMNTHAITLAAWSGFIGAAGLAPYATRWRSPAAGLLVVVLATVWSGVYVARRMFEGVTASRSGRESIGLPGLTWVTANPARALELRSMASAIAEAAAPDARLLLVSHRNDVAIFAVSTPFWLSPRRPATRYHEVHPGIGDTRKRQVEMIASLDTGPLPVVVREHRFTDAALDQMKAGIIQHVDIGSTLLDEWIAGRYEPGPRFGMYEVMRPRRAASAR